MVEVSVGIGLGSRDQGVEKFSGTWKVKKQVYELCYWHISYK